MEKLYKRLHSFSKVPILPSVELLTTKQASEILGVSRRRVIALIEQGKLRARKFSNVYAIDRVDLAAVRNRKNGRPQQERRDFVSFARAAAKYIGTVKGGPPDLSTNKNYLEGLGTKEGERAALARQKLWSKGDE